MKQVNPGNILPFYLDKNWQRHRQTGQNMVPFGLTGTRSRLLPFQLHVTGNASTDVIGFELISAANELVTVALDETLLSRDPISDLSSYWLTWEANDLIDQLPDCGFWYIRITIQAVPYYSEVLYLKDICGEDDARLTLVGDTCSVDGFDLIFSLQAQVFALPGYTYSLQKYTLGYSEISTNELYEITLVEGNESAQLRIEIVTACGRIMHRDYDVTWTSGSACETLTLTLTSSTNNDASVGNNPAWRLLMTNSTDKGDVLYQNGYEQRLYIDPVWNVPEIDRDVQTTVNGNGDIIRRFTRTVEKQRFEFPDMPDYVLGFLAKVGDLDSVTLEEVETGRSLELTNVTFDARQQGPSLNIGVISSDAEIEAFSGCQDNFVLD